ncbi:MAG: phosphoribosylformylglycinamidine synthase subunit PurQ [Alphaproteobacteria bacterium]
MKTAVVVFPGSNCDRDVAVALAAATGRLPVMLWHQETKLDAFDLIVLPGGFAHGDYLRCGAMAAHSPVMREVVAGAGRGTPVLAICNGFQIAVEAGLLPGAFLPNANLRFVCRDVHLRVETSQAIFTNRYRTGEVIRLPVAHHGGNYVAEPATLDRLEDRGQVAFRYCDRQGRPAPEANPNGSVRNIAGVFNDTKTVLGLMPHPERLADERLGGADGRPMFEGLVEALS